jgi:hypothetical protein
MGKTANLSASMNDGFSGNYALQKGLPFWSEGVGKRNLLPQRKATSHGMKKSRFEPTCQWRNSGRVHGDGPDVPNGHEADQLLFCGDARE